MEHSTPRTNPGTPTTPIRAHITVDALIVLDEAKHLNNGQPSLWAIHLDVLQVHPGDQVLHLGCGTGYYTAIMAELTGPQGKVTADRNRRRPRRPARASLSSPGRRSP